ncbi:MULTISPECIES: LysE family translocator [Pseudomonas]|uniref:LysE family translocator n=1 Tax=Pseudomonas TaxID=286 RepID=UPI002499F2A4|nr:MULTISPECIES: LysE family translocator [Pseudomonas]
MSASFLPFVLFALVASITPGPTNLLVLNNGARHGLLASLPAVFGACAAAAAIVLLVGSGFGDLLARLPQVQLAMNAAGIAWLSYLAWKIFRSPPPDLGAPGAMPGRFGLLAAASLQLVNPKTWMMALAVLGVFAGHGPDQGLRTLQLAAIFFVVSLPCLAAWACLGVGSARLLRSPTALRRFNQAMGLLLLVSAWLGLLL